MAVLPVAAAAASGTCKTGSANQRFPQKFAV
eukprot:COSAG01_NODE_57017_length_315_cov_0.601852_1_plen_30_part_01